MPSLSSLAPGSTLGRYAILDKLGEGGMGTVFLARDPELDRRVALKVLTDALQHAEEIRARFVREARLMAKLDHPNIVKVFDAGTTPEGAYIVMELVEGTSLESWLEQRLQPVSEVLEKFLMAGYALAAAHSAGIVHRDFKPANVLIDRKGRVAVTDFGIAAIGEASTSGVESDTLAGSPAMTQVGAIMGTPAFMSPEQFRGEKTDARTDQFSFAVALHDAIFRQPPFAGETLEELKAAVILGRPRELPADAQRRAPPGVYEALRKALAKSPSDRFPTMLVMLRELERCISEAGGTRGARGRVLGLVGIGAVLITSGVFIVRSLHAHEPVVGAADSSALQPPANPPAALPPPAPALTAGVLVGIAEKCLDASKTELELRTCTGAPAQRWHMANGKVVSEDGRCIGPAPGRKGVRVVLELQACAHEPKQAWQVRDGHLVNASDRCANVERSHTEDGTAIVVWECRDAPNSRWHFAPR